MAKFQHLHFVVELYNAMHGHYVATTTITTDSGFVLEFLNEDQQRVLSISYDDQKQTIMELNQCLPTELQAQIQIIQEKWSTSLDMFVVVDEAASEDLASLPFSSDEAMLDDPLAEDAADDETVEQECLTDDSRTDDREGESTTT